MLERDLERGLIEHFRSLILELGKGFAFVGSQYHLEVGERDYYLDLLFYHLRLRCFVVSELKIEDFKPEFAGKKISGQRRMSRREKRALKQRSVIEPEIGHMKTDGLLGRCFLKGQQGDAMNV